MEHFAMTPERIMQMGFAFAPPLMLEAALRNGVFEALAKGPKTVAETAQVTGASVRGLRALMNALAGIELLKKQPDGRYALAPEAATYLVKDSPDYRGDFFRHVSTQLLPAWLSLPEIVRTGTPAVSVNREGPGSAFFQEFVESLFANNYAVAVALAERLVAQRGPALKVLDLAAGSGVWSVAIAERAPQSTVTAVDWPAVLPVTKRVTERHKVATRYRYLEGDLMEVAFGTGYDVALLGHILHSEGEARSKTLLSRVREALAPGGTVAIAEFLVDEERTGPPRSLLFAVNMLVHTDLGDTFSFGEIAEWLRAEGFVDERMLDLQGPSPLILADVPK
jgi:SAM-dependent methyltransferase